MSWKDANLFSWTRTKLPASLLLSKDKKWISMLTSFILHQTQMRENSSEKSLHHLHIIFVFIAHLICCFHFQWPSLYLITIFFSQASSTSARYSNPSQLQHQQQYLEYKVVASKSSLNYLICSLFIVITVIHKSL